MNDRPPMSDRRLRAWLEDGPTTGPDDGLSSALARTRSTRQRPGWLVAIRGDPMETTWRARPSVPGRPVLVMVTMLLVAITALAGLVVGAGLLTPPRPRLVVAPPSFPAGATPMLAFASSPLVTAPGTDLHRLLSQLYVVGADGLDGRILGVHGRPVWPVWSPDGTRIAFSTIDGLRHGLHVIDPDGVVRQLADVPTCGDPGAPAWSPDGRYLLYVVGAPAGDGRCAATLNHVFVVPADGSAPGRPLLAAGDDRFTLSPTWGPAGIAMQGIDGSSGQLLVADVPDPEHPWDLTARQITTGPAGTDAFSHAAWSPDGRSIATTHVDPGERGTFGSARIYPLDGGPATVLGTDEQRLIQPSWSPDGTWLAALAAGENGYEVVIVDIAGAILRTLPATGIDPDAGGPAISPDGRWIAVRRTGYKGAGELLIADVAGQGEPLTIPALGGGGLSWQPQPTADDPAANASPGLPNP